MGLQEKRDRRKPSRTLGAGIQNHSGCVLRGSDLGLHNCLNSSLLGQLGAWHSLMSFSPKGALSPARSDSIAIYLFTFSSVFSVPFFSVDSPFLFVCRSKFSAIASCKSPFHSYYGTIYADYCADRTAHCYSPVSAPKRHICLLMDGWPRKTRLMTLMPVINSCHHLCCDAGSDPTYHLLVPSMHCQRSDTRQIAAAHHAHLIYFKIDPST